MVEPAGASPDGRPRFRGRVRLADGTKSERFDVPAGMTDTQAKAWVADIQAKEDVEHGLLSAKRDRMRSTGADIEATGPLSGEWKIAAYRRHYFVARRASDRVEDVDSEEGRLKHLAMLDDVRIGALTTPAYRAAMLRVRDHDRKPDGSRLAPRTIIHVHRTFALMMRTAVAEGVISTNPCTLLPGDLPAKKDKDPTWRRTARFSRAELRALISDARIPEDRRTFWAVMFLASTRFGEAAALRWADYDPAARPLGKLTIEKSYSTKRRREKDTKTEVPREMPVLPLLAGILAAWKASGWKDMAGREPKPEDLIVPSREGRNRNVNHMLRRFKQDCERIGLRARRQHDTRRTFISLAREGGASDLLKWCTHGAPGEIIDQYTTPSWAVLCREALCAAIESSDPGSDPVATKAEEAGAVTPSTSSLGRSMAQLLNTASFSQSYLRGGRDLNPRPPA